MVVYDSPAKKVHRLGQTETYLLFAQVTDLLL